MDNYYDGRLRSGTLYYYADVAARALISRLLLKDPVDEGALKRAYEETIRRHPYITKGLREENGCFYLVDNHNPMPLLQTEENLVLGGERAGGHLYGITWHDRRINLYFYHGLIDGMAAQRVMETLLYYYCSLKNNKSYDPEGIWINDGTSYEGCDSEPFEKEYEIGDESAAEDVAEKQDTCFHFSELDAGWDRNEHTGFEIHASADEFMRLVKSEGLTPTSAAAVLLSQAVMRLYPENTKPIKTAMPVNIRQAIGMKNTHKNATLDIGLYFDPVRMQGKTLAEQGRILREQLRRQTNPEYLKSMANSTIDWLKKFEQAGSYEGCLETFRGMPRSFVDTFFLSYVGRLHLPGYEDEVQEISLVSHSRNSIIIDMTEMGGQFIFGFRQCVPSPFFADAFTEVLTENGIRAVRSEGVAYTLPYVEFRETMGLKERGGSDE